MTNEDFAGQVGCHHSMASRMRSGDRTPSLALLSRIVEAYDIRGADLQRLREALAASAATPAPFGRWLRSTIIDTNRRPRG